MSDTDQQIQTASESRQQLSPHSTLATSLSNLTPATAKAGTAELMACLTLVAPSGMTAEDRKAWVAVAKATLTGIPADLLSRGCAKARETCRFASEIVPTIIEEVQDTWKWRRRMAVKDNAASQLEAPRYERVAVPHEVTQRILKEVREQMARGSM